MESGLTCSKGHPLKAAKKDDNFKCDKCGNLRVKENFGLRCDACDFDMCKFCKQGVPPPPNDEGAVKKSWGAKAAKNVFDGEND